MQLFIFVYIYNVYRNELGSAFGVYIHIFIHSYDIFITV